MHGGHIAASLLPPRLRRWLAQKRAWIFDSYAVKTHSQEGEDLILRRIFADQARGFYVDIGAHHPRRFSNTHEFYLRGWSGINIDPSSEAVRALVRERKRDTNLQLGVAEQPQTLVYHMFDEPALNTFDAELAQWRARNTPYKLIGTRDVAVERLDSILRKHLPAGQKIDFMSVDVEGLDLPVLRSNDWTSFRPTCVLAEALGTSLEEVMRSDVYEFMRANRYRLFSKLYNTLVFLDADV
jgi:FkbM family methyltransferase